jgi:hypothetical protein
MGDEEGCDMVRVLRTTIEPIPGVGNFAWGGSTAPVGQVTEFLDPVTHYLCWVREVAKPPGGWFCVSSNHRWGLKAGVSIGESWPQALELAVPKEISMHWSRIARLVREYDALQRPVLHNQRWTEKTAKRLFRERRIRC